MPTTIEETILRDATLTDIKTASYLIGQLIEHEEEISGTMLCVEDKSDRENGIYEILAEALIDNDYKFMVVDKKGSVVGVFIAYITERSKLFKHDKICTIWAGFTKKSPLFLAEIDNTFARWGKERGCSGLCVNVLDNHKRFQKVLENKLKYDRITISYEKDIEGGTL